MAKISCCFLLHFTNARTEGAQKAFPDDIGAPTLDRKSKIVIFFHDESKVLV